MTLKAKAPRPKNSPLDIAREYVKAGFSIIPIAIDGSKAPAVDALPQNSDGRGEWSSFQKKRPTLRDLDKWYGDGQSTGIAIVGGKVSKGLAIIDFDDKAVFDRWKRIVEKLNPKLLASLSMVATPSGGRHVYLRTVTTFGNTKVASRQVNEEGKPRKKTLVEIKSEGGYCLAPGSPKECHPNRKLYRHVSGPSICRTPKIPPSEAALLINTARSLDECAPIHAEPKSANGKRPGDEFNRTAEWNEILAPHGWKKVTESNGTTYWCRPEKTTGVSATTGYCSSEKSGDLLYVFSSNAAPFEDGQAYSKFAAKTFLEFDGDFAKCAKAIGHLGIGGATTDDDGEPQIDLDSIEAMSFAEGVEVFQKWLVDLDIGALELVMGVVAANALDADPVFLFIVGPPSAGKTELVRALYGHPATKHISSMTPAALISGYDGDTDPSLSERPKRHSKARVRAFAVERLAGPRCIVGTCFPRLLTQGLLVRVKVIRHAGSVTAVRS